MIIQNIYISQARKPIDRYIEDINAKLPEGEKVHRNLKTSYFNPYSSFNKNTHLVPSILYITSKYSYTVTYFCCHPSQ